MDKMIVTVFDNEAAAYEGSHALQALHDNGDIVLYGMAVINKDAHNVVTIKKADGPAPWGTVGGLAVGAVVGLLGGPAGVVLGAATGALVGTLGDLGNAGVGADYVDEVSAQLLPGTTAVVAEVDEEWRAPVDARMAALGGRVYRRIREDVVDAQIERDLTALEADLAQAEAELAQADANARAYVQANVDADKARFQAARDRAEARIETLQQEADAKVKAVKDQAAKAQAEQKAKLEARAAEIRADYDGRIAKLRQAMEKGKEADALTRDALKP